MSLQDLLSEIIKPNSIECWAEESTASALRALAVRVHATGAVAAGNSRCVGVCRRVTVASSDLAMGASSRRQRARPADGAAVAVDENAIQVGTEWYWLYATIDLDSKLLLGVRLSQRRGSSPAAAFLHQLKAQHDLSDAYFLVDGYGYLTALARTDLRGDLEYVHRNKIEKWFQTLKNAGQTLPQHLDRQRSQRAALAALPSSITITSSDRIRRSTDAHLRRSF